MNNRNTMLNLHFQLQNKNNLDINSPALSGPLSGDLVHKYLLRLSQESHEPYYPLFNYLDSLVTNFSLEQTKQGNLFCWNL